MRKLLSIIFTPLLFITVQGLAQEKGKRVEAESYNEIHRAATKEGDGGTIVNKFDRGAWIKFDNLDLGKGTEQIKFRTASGATQGKPHLEVRLGDHEGKLLGTLDVEPKGWGKYSEHTMQIPKTEGKQTITIVSPGGAVLLNWFELK